MNRLNLKKIIIIIIFLVVGLFFVFDPYNWWPLPPVGISCTPENVSPRCTGKINFF